MKKNKIKNVNVDQTTSTEQTATEQTATEQAPNELETRVQELEARVKDLEDLKLRQMAEFDNYRRRTNKEKLELMETAGEKIFVDMLNLVDDFERAEKAIANTDDVAVLKEGVDLIYQKFITFLNKNNVHAIETEGVDFSTDEHEAITMFAAGEDKKGKIIDCTQRGWKLGEKVIRYAKVVVGE